jgi:glycosyltransferase involved in cell wall biosynthesis
MRAKPDTGRSRRQHPRVLQLAHACNPYKGSDAGVGWARALETAKSFDTWVICGHWDRQDITRYLAEHGEIPRPHFCFLEPWWLEERLKIGRPLFYTHFLPHHLWHRRAFKLAARLHQELKFDLVHQVTLVGYREPGYLWKLDAPFIWGPVGGTQNYPWRFLPLAGVIGGLTEGLRSIINYLQFRFSPRIRQVIRKAAVVLSANSNIQRDFARVHGVRPKVLLETGVTAITEETSKQIKEGGSLRIIWSGEFKPHKALPLLIHALAEVPPEIPYELRILGAGPLENLWKKLARAKGLEPHCRWLGWLDPGEALQQFSWAEVLVFTSLRDTSGNVVLEALSRGVPVICLDHQGVGDIVTDNCGIRIPVTTPEEVIVKLRRRLVALAADRARLEALSMGALRRAPRYLWSKNGVEMARIYRQVLQRATGSI